MFDEKVYISISFLLQDSNLIFNLDFKIKMNNIINNLISYKNYINRMLIVYSVLTLFNITMCSIISYNGYIIHHIEMSIFMIITNIINGGYYLILKNSFHNIFMKPNDCITITSNIRLIDKTTKIDLLINLIVLIITIVLFILWVGNNNSLDRNLLILEYTLNTYINIFSLYFCYINISQMNVIFNANNYQITYYNQNSPITIV